MSGVTGDFRGLAALIKNVEKAQRGGLQTRLAQELAAEARKQVADEFRGERDPYGEPWAPLKRERPRNRRASRRAVRAGRAPRRGKILRNTGYMAGHIATNWTPRGFSLTFLAPYSRFHQDGTKHMARRALLPSKGWGGLGPIWARAFNRTTRRVVKDVLGNLQRAQGSQGGMG